MNETIHDKIITTAFEQNKYVREHKLDRNKETEDFGHVVARIPYTVTYKKNPDGTLTITNLDLTGWNALCTLYPDLASPDSEISTRAWYKFLKDTEKSAPYKVDGSIGKRKSTHNIIVT